MNKREWRFWNDFAQSRTSGDVVGIANEIRRGAETAEQVARNIIPHVVELLEGHGFQVTGQNDG